MITKDEIIKQLVGLNIIFSVGDMYMLTERYKELLELENKPKIVPVEAVAAPVVVDRDKLLDATTNGSDWPVELLESKGRARAGVLMDLCEVPILAAKGYRLRGLNLEAINIIGNIMDSKEVDPNSMIESIKNYYEGDMPKSFKNYLLDGDFYDVYLEYISGDYDANKPVKKWS